MAKCPTCDTKLAPDKLCRRCAQITLHNTDTLVRDERGLDVWARTLAKRYRAMMERWIKPKKKS